MLRDQQYSMQVNSQHRQLWELQALHLSILARCITLQSIFKYLSAISPELTGLIWITTGSLCSLFVFLQKCTYLQSTPKHWNAPSSARDLAEHLLIPCLITVGLRSFLLSSIRVRPILCFLNKCQTIFRNLFQGACWTSLKSERLLATTSLFSPSLLIDALKEFLRVYVLMNSLQVLPGCGLSNTFFFLLELWFQPDWETNASSQRQ